MIKKLIPLLVLSLLMCGCPRTQEYSRPKMPVPAAWPEAEATPAADTPSAAEVGWKEFFADAKLRGLIELALAQNRDLRMAALHIQKVEELYRIQSAERVPQLNAAATGEGYRIPRNLSSNDRASTVADYRVGLSMASWELDLFGRIRSLKAGILEQYLATEQARSATQISLVAAIAQACLALAADREYLQLAQATLEVQQASYDLIRRIAETGMRSELDVRQARALVDASQADIARYTGQIRLDENAIQLLAGAPVAGEMMPTELNRVVEGKEIAPRLASDVLLQRPDIAMAEHQLKAAYANIAVARASFFPRISLTAAAGLASSDLTNLFTPGSATWSFAPQAALPLFDAGLRKANYQAMETDRDLAVAAYEKAIQTAFREVSDALTLRSSLAAQLNAQQALVSDLEAAFRLSQARYDQGIDGYLGVLVAQRSLYSAQQGLLALRTQRLANRVTLYKTLGGGGITEKAPLPSSMTKDAAATAQGTVKN